VPTNLNYDESLRSNIVKDIKKFAAFFVEKNMFIKMHMIYKRFGGDRSAGAAFQQLARYSIFLSLHRLQADRLSCAGFII